MKCSTLFGILLMVGIVAFVSGPANGAAVVLFEDGFESYTSLGVIGPAAPTGTWTFDLADMVFPYDIALTQGDCPGAASGGFNSRRLHRNRR